MKQKNTFGKDTELKLKYEYENENRNLVGEVKSYKWSKEELEEYLKKYKKSK